MSSIVKILDRDSSGFLDSLTVPLKVLATAPMLLCIAMWSWGTYNLYGAVDMKVIKLMLDSKPSDAKVYLVPNRIWMFIYEKDEKWKKGISYEYLVDRSTTNTSVNINQTVDMGSF